MLAEKETLAGTGATTSALIRTVEQQQLGLVATDGTFNHCSLSLAPWTLKTRQFETACETAKALSHLFTEVSNKTDYLIDAVADYQISAGLLSQLKKTLGSNATITARNFNFSRQDLMLDRQQLWRLVETNSIAAGMGPFSQTVVGIHKTLATNKSLHFAPNSATGLQSLALFKAASAINNNPRPLIIFVIQAAEDNIIDQAMLASALTELGAKVVYRTLSQLALELKSDEKHLLYDEQALENHFPENQTSKKSTVDLLYYRSGYNLDDYIDESGKAGELLALRQWTEQHQVVVCPSINYQIATSKWLQMKLSALTPVELSNYFNINAQQASLASSALSSNYQIPENYQQIKDSLGSGRWILKSQNEGGGNVFNEHSYLDAIEQQEQYLLMQKIDVQPRLGKIDILTRHQIITHENVISELGIFTLGDEHAYGGYLLRSKPQNMLEAGIHKGWGFLDTIALS